ncbi:MAG: hypothetical protein IPL74_11600 [Bacteroidetes bacterium]|nr:hypothetical protein [Bacteroidota bacterium]
MLKWDEAIIAYMQYGEFLGKEEPIDDITRRVAECKNGLELTKNPIKVKIENLGLAINTKNPEYNPLITADEAELFFTSRGPAVRATKQILKILSTSKIFIPVKE